MNVPLIESAQVLCEPPASDNHFCLFDSLIPLCASRATVVAKKRLRCADAESNQSMLCTQYTVDIWSHCTEGLGFCCFIVGKLIALAVHYTKRSSSTSSATALFANRTRPRRLYCNGYISVSHVCNARELDATTRRHRIVADFCSGKFWTIALLSVVLGFEYTTINFL